MTEYVPDPDPFGDYENFDIGWQEPFNSCQLCGSQVYLGRFCGRCDPSKDF